jgi:hypothetical protein
VEVSVVSRTFKMEVVVVSKTFKWKIQLSVGQLK